MLDTRIPLRSFALGFNIVEALLRSDSGNGGRTGHDERCMARDDISGSP